MFPQLYSVPFFLVSVLSMVMLVTDKNLQTNFGTVSSGYFVHWYGVLAIAIIALVAGVVLLLVRSRTTVKLGLVGAGLLTAAWLGVILTYSQVGFASASDFAQYLFGITYYGGNLRYLYDVILAVLLGAVGMGAVGLSVMHDADTGADTSGAKSPATS